MQAIRSQAKTLAAVSAGAPLLVLGLVAAPWFLRTSRPIPAAVVYVVLGAFLAVNAVRIILSGSLTSTEQAIVRFWSFTPMLVVPIATTLGATPLLLLYALGVQLGPGAVRTVVAVLLVLSALVVWQLWLRFHASLSGEPPKGDRSG